MPPEVIRFILRFILALLVISLVLSLYNWKNLSEAFKYLAYYLILNLLIEAINFTILRKTNNLPLLHAYTLLEFFLFSMLYKKVGLFEKWPDKNFWIFLGSVSTVIILNSLLLQSIYSYNSYAKTVVQVLLIIYAISFIFQLNEKNEESESLNLMNAGVLIFYSGSLFIFMFGNVLLADEFDTFFWDINLLLNVLFQVLILISIWKASKVKKLQF